jgi:3-dehydroquinate dehydratase-2
LLGNREPELYGKSSLRNIEKTMLEIIKGKNINILFFQSNSEGEIIDFIHKEGINRDYLIANLGAYTHTSIAIRDAILGIGIKTIEVHISNIYKRESFRHHSYISDIAIGVISGFGMYSYVLALNYILMKENLL